MRVIARKTLVAFWTRHPETQAALTNWYRIVSKADWRSMQALKADMSSATPLNGDRVKFDILGGNFRLIAAVDFTRSIVFVKFVGTHAEYDRIDALTVTRH